MKPFFVLKFIDYLKFYVYILYKYFYDNNGEYYVKY